MDRSTLLLLSMRMSVGDVLPDHFGEPVEPRVRLGDGALCARLCFGEIRYGRRHDLDEPALRLRVYL